MGGDAAAPDIGDAGQIPMISRRIASQCVPFQYSLPQPWHRPYS